MKFPPDSTFSHRLFTSGFSGYVIENLDCPGNIADYHWKVLILQQRLSRKHFQLGQGDNRISSKATDFQPVPSSWLEKWFFQSWQSFTPSVFVFWAKKGLKYNMSHIIWLIWPRSCAYCKSQTVSAIIYGSVGDRYLKSSWKGNFLSGHSRWLSPRFYFTWTTLERLFQTYYKCTGLAHLDCYFVLANVHWHHTTSHYQIDILFE